MPVGSGPGEGERGERGDRGGVRWEGERGQGREHGEVARR